MYNEMMNKSLESSKRFVDSLLTSELDEIMKEYDNYEVINNSSFYHHQTFHSYVNVVYNSLELFKLFRETKRKSIVINEKDCKKDLVKGPFLLN